MTARQKLASVPRHNDYVLKSEIILPDYLDMPNGMELSLRLANQKPADVFVINFARVRNVEPFGMLVVSSEMRRLLTRFPAARLVPENHRHLTYPAHMGFFKACGFEIGKAPGQAKGSARYLPLTMLACDELRRKAVQNNREVGDEVEGESRHLARMLCGEDDGVVFDTLSYSLREMMRNVVEHSNAPDIWLCAQYWPTKSKVEVAIVDLGIGLRASLSHNPHLDASDDKRALNYALMPAVSGKAYKGAKQRQKGPWANSGFGLYMVNRICRNGGNFFIASGETGMLLTRASHKRYFDCRYQGTAVRMVIRTNEIADLRDALAVYRNEGYKIQLRYKEIVNIDPSSASLMLSEDFDLNVWDRLLAKVKGSRKNSTGAS